MTKTSQPLHILDRVKDYALHKSLIGDRAQVLVGGLERSDSLADEAIACTAGWSRRALMQAVEAGVCDVAACPEELRPLMEHATSVPAWVDFEQVERGANFFMSTHVPGGVVLGARSLVLGYTSPAGNKPLMMSGRLERGVNRRLAETSKFVYEVCRSGGMAPGSGGVVATLKVRLIHAQVRAMIGRTDGWRPEAWGLPINQHDMLATILLFSHALLTGLQKLGVRVTDQEARDYIALWRYVGHILGVEHALLPRNPEDASRLFEFIDRTQGEPDDDARALTRVFLQGPPDDDPQQETPQAARHAANTVVRDLLGEQLADALDVAPSTRGQRLALGSAKVAIRAYDTFRSSPVTRARAVRAGERYWEWVMEHNPAGAVELTLPDQLLRTTLGKPHMSV